MQMYPQNDKDSTGTCPNGLQKAYSPHTQDGSISLSPPIQNHLRCDGVLFLHALEQKQVWEQCTVHPTIPKCRAGGKGSHLGRGSGYLYVSWYLPQKYLPRRCSSRCNIYSSVMCQNNKAKVREEVTGS